MPTYEYLCEACKNEWEELQGINEEPLQKCPKCKKKKVKRQLGTPSFVLKGGGWASDGYSKS